MKHKIKMGRKPVRYVESYSTRTVNTVQTMIGGRAAWLDTPAAGPKPIAGKKKKTRK
jgi:hypothetical protein